jgi:hypothetical protein
VLGPGVDVELEELKDAVDLGDPHRGRRAGGSAATVCSGGAGLHDVVVDRKPVVAVPARPRLVFGGRK